MGVCIYSGAALFNLRERLFNSILERSLSRKGHRIILPQREGFDYVSLENSLKQDLSTSEISKAIYDIIYCLDMDLLIPSCDILLANLDEPLDIGVDSEISRANELNKYAIGFRTDIRTPYGSINNKYAGMQPFPVKKCSTMIIRHTKAITYDSLIKEVDGLTIEIDSLIKKASIVPKDDKLISLGNAKSLFDGMRLEDINTSYGLSAIAQRYLKHKDEF
jgi:nucleoside 2-deoxyribosyltransferase